MDSNNSIATINNYKGNSFYSTRNLSVGFHNIYSKYFPDNTNFKSSTSPASGIYVDKANTTTFIEITSLAFVDNYTTAYGNYITLSSKTNSISSLIGLIYHLSINLSALS